MAGRKSGGYEARKPSLATGRSPRASQGAFRHDIAVPQARLLPVGHRGALAFRIAVAHYPSGAVAQSRGRAVAQMDLPLLGHGFLALPLDPDDG
jgi:hypothetical protein